MVSLVLAPGILDEVIAHATGCYPAEGCGLITPTRFIPVTNVAQSASEYEMDPAELIKALRDMRDAGEQLLAIYHSHPHGPERPSKTDIERAYYPEAAHLIVSLAELKRPRAAAFRLIDGEAVEIEVHAIV